MSKTIKIIGEILAIETIAEGHGIREIAQLRQRYGHGNWRKKKGLATNAIKLRKQSLLP